MRSFQFLAILHTLLRTLEYMTFYHVEFLLGTYEELTCIISFEYLYNGVNFYQLTRCLLFVSLYLFLISPPLLPCLVFNSVPHNPSHLCLQLHTHFLSSVCLEFTCSIFTLYLVTLATLTRLILTQYNKVCLYLSFE